MSRRRIVSAIGALVTALALAVVVPPYFSPIPGLVAELKECLEPVTDEPCEAAPGQAETIQIDLLVAGLNTTRAGTTLLTPEDAFCGGLVRDGERMREVLQQLRMERCARIPADTRLVTVSGKPAEIVFGGEVGVASNVDGETVIQYKAYGTSARAVPTLCKDGRIHLQLELTQTALRPGSPVLNPEFDVVARRASLALKPGHTGFIGGVTQRCKQMQEYRLPLASDLPGVGSWFRVSHEAEIDEELLILATPHLVPRSQNAGMVGESSAPAGVGVLPPPPPRVIKPPSPR